MDGQEDRRRDLVDEITERHRATPCAPAPSCSAGAALASAVDDDAHEDDDHAHERREVGSSLRCRMGVEVAIAARLEVGDHVREARERAIRTSPAFTSRGRSVSSRRRSIMSTC